MNLAIWMAVLVYAAAAIYLGWRSGKMAGDGAVFWTADRNLGAASVGLSISAGFMSVSWSCVYAVQLFYWYGLAAVWLITVPWLLTLIQVRVTAAGFPAAHLGRTGCGANRVCHGLQRGQRENPLLACRAPSEGDAGGA